MYTKLAGLKCVLTKLRHGTLLCAVLMMLSCAQMSSTNAREGDRYGSPTLQKRLDSGDYVAAILIDEKQQISVFAAGGEDITNNYCGKVAQDGRIVVNEKLPKEERCDLKGIDLLNIKNIELYTIKKNPNCILVGTAYGLVWMHAGGDGFPGGARPCHAAPH